MSPILGIWASAQQRSVAPAFESIATVTVGSGGSSTVTFSSIPSTYKHLQVRFMARTDRAADTNDAVRMQFNSDTATNYSNHYLSGNTSSISSGYTNTTSVIYSATVTAASATANAYGISIVDILEYANTNIYKTVRILGGNDNNGTGYMQFNSANWRNTNAISSITLTPNVGTNFIQYSHFALYGVKA